MKSAQSPAESHICHVADAPEAQQHQRGSDDAANANTENFCFPPPTTASSDRYASPRALVEEDASLRALPGEYPSEASTHRAHYVTSALDVQPSETSSDAAGSPAVTAAVLLAAESHPPSKSGMARTSTLSAQKPYGNHYAAAEYPAAADPFISESAMDAAEDEASYPGYWSSETAQGMSSAKASARLTATEADGVPQRLPEPTEDRVRGYSVMQPSPLTASLRQASGAADQQRTVLYPNEKPTTAKPKGAAADRPRSLPPIERGAEAEAPGARSAHVKAAPMAVGASPSTGLSRSTGGAALPSEADRGALVPTATADALSLATYSRDEAYMKDLVSHVDRNSFGFDLRDALQSIDFATVLAEYRQSSSVESAALRDCRRLFRIVAKNKDAVSAEDVYDLLVLFTPCGAAFREGVDFLWENCEGKLSLSFEHFLLYGPRLRARLRGYELFSQLSDRERILVTHHRVLPDEPLGEANDARVHLLQVADEQLEGTLRPHARALRLYEELFLVEFQEMLYEAALIPADEVPQRVAAADFAHEPHHALPRLSVPVLQKENTDWRADGSGGGEESTGAAASRPADRHLYVVGYSESEASSGISPVHRDANRGVRAGQPSRPPGALSGRGAAQTKRGAATARAAKAGYGPYDSNPARTARNGESLAVSLRTRPHPDTRKNLGRFVEEEYWERRTLDDHLITQLQGMYSTK